MATAAGTGKTTRSNRALGWLAVPFVLFAIYGILGWFDTTTEITPSHDAILAICFEAGGLAALLLAGVAVFRRQKMTAWRVRQAIALTILGFLSVSLLSVRLARIIENHIDFPAGHTRTYPALLIIKRAYRTEGKGRSWNIQTMPIWSNLDITEYDYSFMLNYRRPGDDGHNPNEISSEGYFCAQVIMQESGNALRVLNAGSRKLPRGTVVVCP
jgi:hypothetical protein